MKLLLQCGITIPWKELESWEDVALCAVASIERGKEDKGYYLKHDQTVMLADVGLLPVWRIIVPGTLGPYS